MHGFGIDKQRKIKRLIKPESWVMNSQKSHALASIYSPRWKWLWGTRKSLF
jgi:hypothetical protein